MDLQNASELNQYQLRALHSLLEEVTPTQLRHTVEDLFFQYQAGHLLPLTPDQVRDVHLLVRFLNEVEIGIENG